MPDPNPSAGRRRSAQPRKGDLRERAILDAAEAQLEAVGSAAMTVETIATGAGISRASLYFYFGSKRDVLTALVARTIAIMRADARAAATEDAEPPAETIARAVQQTARVWLEHGRVLGLAVELSPTVPEIAALWDETVDAYAAAMAETLVRAGLPDGDGPTDARALAAALCWMTERSLFRAYAGAPDDPAAALHRAAQTAAEVWRRALVAR